MRGPVISDEGSSCEGYLEQKLDEPRGTRSSGTAVREKHILSANIHQGGSLAGAPRSNPADRPVCGPRAKDPSLPRS